MTDIKEKLQQSGENVFDAHIDDISKIKEEKIERFQEKEKGIVDSLAKAAGGFVEQQIQEAGRGIKNSIPFTDKVCEVCGKESDDLKCVPIRSGFVGPIRYKYYCPECYKKHSFSDLLVY